ncbi:hypothetical protein G7Z17_g10550 [Cylindrodendrum hubeiense]|uniref:Ankyrin n=1 Tax=Cylindrodendrum hubeiense TaxID=595255 RepID=A0A9P5GXI1_9HYPO|nr:hypothetical protein G7Z17_g10550 [Cylindrodendrum hubeiense]
MGLAASARGIIKVLLKHGADVNALSAAGVSPIHTIIETADKDPSEPAERLHAITTGSAPGMLDIDALDKDGMTPLARLVSMRAVRTLRQRMLVMLVRNGANIHAKQKCGAQNSLCSGGTPLHFACYNHDPVMLKFLIDKGASEDVNSRTDAGFTPLMILVTAAAEGIIARNELASMKNILLDAGADPTVKNSEGKSAQDIWIEKNPSTGQHWIWKSMLGALDDSNYVRE